VNNNQDNFSDYLKQPEEDIQLDRASLLIARHFNHDLDIDYYLHQLDHMAEEIRSRLIPEHSESDIHDEILEYLYLDCEYKGNVKYYYDAHNSFLNDVLERKKGIPISLSILHIEIARRLGVEISGIAFPGQFIISGNYGGELVYWNPFLSGSRMSEKECGTWLEKISEGRITFDPSYLKPVSSKLILQRMLINLKWIFIKSDRTVEALDTVEMLLAISANPSQEIRDRGILRLRYGDLENGIEDLRHYLALNPEAEDAPVVRMHLQRLVNGKKGQSGEGRG
jgi:regulator of sirC expression with transglutaminase-like and TPR domain